MSLRFFLVFSVLVGAACDPALPSAPSPVNDDLPYAPMIELVAPTVTAIRCEGGTQLNGVACWSLAGGNGFEYEVSVRKAGTYAALRTGKTECSVFHFPVVPSVLNPDHQKKATGCGLRPSDTFSNYPACSGTVYELRATALGDKHVTVVVDGVVTRQRGPASEWVPSEVQLNPKCQAGVSR